jgi:hypothetical protein
MSKRNIHKVKEYTEDILEKRRDIFFETIKQKLSSSAV